MLAGGRSKRFRSEVPKVLHPAAGRPLVQHVLEALRAVHRTQPLRAASLVVPPGGAVEATLGDPAYPFPLAYAVQRRPRGTGDALRCGLGRLGEVDEVLVLAGDAPLVHPSSLRALIRERRRHKAAAAVLTATLPDPGSYGRILRGDDSSIAGVVEARDASPEQFAIREINTCTYVFATAALARMLPKLRSANAQGEYYLTDVIGLLAASDQKIVGVEGDPDEVLGTNTRAEFATVVSRLRWRVLEDLMAAGVTVDDPASTYVDVGVRVGADSVLLPHTFLEGDTRVGRGCEIGPSVRLVDSRVGDAARVTFAVARGARIGPEAEVGPFASLRPGTVLRKGAKAGTFVEMKAADIGEGSKVPHLSYMGDVTVGRGSNVGAGTITCNYDPFRRGPGGRTKHETRIGDEVFIGSDTMLVAPVSLGNGSRTGAGSVVTRNVEPGELVVGAPAQPRGDKKATGRKAAKSPRRKAKGSRKDA